MTVGNVTRQHTLGVLFSNALGRSQIGLDDNFFALGGDPESARSLVRSALSSMNVSISMETLVAHPTVRLLHDHLFASVAPPDPRVVLPLRRPGDRAPLFCVHPGSGFGLPYAGLLPHLDTGVPVFALQARGLIGAAALPATMEDMAADYVEQIRAVRPRGPYRLLGWCLGGRVAFEVACRLRAAGEPVDLLAVIGAAPPDGRPLAQPGVTALSMLQPPDRDEADPELERLCQGPLDFAAISAHLKRSQHPMRRLSGTTLSSMHDVYRNGERISRDPVAGHFNGDMVLMEAAGGRAEHAPDPSPWRPYVGGDIAVYSIPGRHAQMMDPAPARLIGTVIGPALR